jgi:hypothetical protein
MTTPREEKDERDALIEAAAAAWRPRDADGRVREHPGWHDLDATGREEAFEAARINRTLEAALDPDGMSSTVRAVLRRLRGAGGGAPEL